MNTKFKWIDLKNLLFNHNKVRERENLKKTGIKNDSKRVVMGFNQFFLRL